MARPAHRGQGLLAKLAGLDFTEEIVPPDDPMMRAELLLQSPSYLVPCLIHGGLRIWDTLAIAEYLNEIRPKAGLVPEDRADRARCRSICGEMHQGFSALRSSMPMNIRARHPGYIPHAGARADIDRITTIWRECLALSGGPYLFGDLSMDRVARGGGARARGGAGIRSGILAARSVAGDSFPPAGGIPLTGVHPAGEPAGRSGWTGRKRDAARCRRGSTACPGAASTPSSSPRSASPGSSTGSK